MVINAEDGLVGLLGSCYTVKPSKEIYAGKDRGGEIKKLSALKRKKLSSQQRSAFANH